MKGSVKWLRVPSQQAQAKTPRIRGRAPAEVLLMLTSARAQGSGHVQSRSTG
jgi:hypothetical protein